MPLVLPKPATKPRPSGKDAGPRRIKSGIRLRIVRSTPRRRGVRIRIAKLRPARGVLILRIAKPALLTRWLSAPGRGRSVALSIVPGEMKLAVATPGAVASWRRFSVQLPGRSVSPGIQSSNLQAPKAMVFALRGLWRQTGLRKRRGGALSLVIPDQSVRMVSVPLEGRAPSTSEGNAMARWALRNALPQDHGDYRIDWAVLSGDSTPEARNWLFALAASASVVREYEALVERLGLSVGRVVPASLAVAASTDRAVAGDPTTARIVLCEMGGLPAALVEADGIPRLHRAWRSPPADLSVDLRAIDTYVRQRLDLTLVEALVAGPRDWCSGVASACAARGWHTTSVSSWSAHRGAMQ